MSEAKRNSDAPSSQADQLVELVREAAVELWHTDTRTPYVTVKEGTNGEHFEHYALKAEAAREWMSALYLRKFGQVARSQALKDAVIALSGLANFQGAEHQDFVRIGECAGRIYLDLGLPDWQVVEISSEGWSIVATPPVRFRRPAGMLPLPLPARGGSLNALRALLHLKSDDDWTLLIGWLVGVLRARGPYTLLALRGEEGSSKSTTARMLRRLIDPSAADLRGEPRDPRDLIIAAQNGWIVGFDNLSQLSPWQSDALCRISTGGSLTDRQLFTNDGEHIKRATRPVLLTSIPEVVQRADLQDRTITITLPRIPESRRRNEAELWAQYKQDWPAMLGTLLDAAVMALRREPTVHLVKRPRMLDWATWATAAEPALGLPDGAVVAAFDRMRQDAIEANLADDLLALGIRSLSLPWVGTAEDLLNKLTRNLGGKAKAPRGWPDTPRKLRSELDRLIDQFRSVGICVTYLGPTGRKRHRLIRIERPEARA